MAKRVGRPRIFETSDDLLSTFNDYIADCERTNRVKTITGFCVFAELYKELLFEYNEREEFTKTISQIRSIIENDVEEGILHEKYNVTAGIFNLKNNFGWKDKTEVDSTNRNHNVTETYDGYKKRLLQEENEAKNAKKNKVND